MAASAKIFIISFILISHFNVFSHKAPVLQVIGDNIGDVKLQNHAVVTPSSSSNELSQPPQKLRAPVFGSAFLIKVRNPRTGNAEVLIVTAAHVAAVAHMSCTRGKNRLFVSPIGSSKCFSVLPKAASACDDAVILCLENPNDIKEILKTTAVHTLMEIQEFESLRGFIARHGATLLSIAGCDSHGAQPEVFCTPALWRGRFEKPTMPHCFCCWLEVETEQPIFGGISGGCVIANNKIIGLVSASSICIQVQHDNNSAILKYNKASQITGLYSIKGACDKYFSLAEPFTRHRKTSTQHQIIDIDYLVLFPPDLLPQEFETHAALSQEKYQPEFSLGYSELNRQQFALMELNARLQIHASLNQSSNTVNQQNTCLTTVEFNRLQVCNEMYLYSNIKPLVDADQIIATAIQRGLVLKPKVSSTPWIVGRHTRGSLMQTLNLPI